MIRVTEAATLKSKFKDELGLQTSEIMKYKEMNMAFLSQAKKMYN
eukprot:CAMPEP_0116927812 /NCGR_PEP_ID=MMETSP0467-20121206/25595_1 /TAXON_ID=283647 /ORGANISM="Mesodinium pulex, Strain SPMC105" /LENGTH=44 /DNA_ID= /DNA_START= /DNA_END= /DNA_ORIENTATION=